MKDIAFIRPLSLYITGTIKDSSTDDGLLLYQKIIVMILSSVTSTYRQNAGTAFILHVGKGNIVGTTYLKTLLLTACSQAKQCLDLLDRNKIKNISVLLKSEGAIISVQLKNDEIYTGTIK